MPNIQTHPIHLGLGATAQSLPEFTGEMQWYADYSAAHASDGSEGRLVSYFRFTENWGSWEMHPKGEEVVLYLSGQMTVYQDHSDGRAEHVTLNAGDYAINPPGTWHTADVVGEATALFITAGEGTEHKPR